MNARDYNPEPINPDPNTTGAQINKDWNIYFNSQSYENIFSLLIYDYGLPEDRAADHIYGIFMQGWIAAKNSKEE